MLLDSDFDEDKGFSLGYARDLVNCCDMRDAGLW